MPASRTTPFSLSIDNRLHFLCVWRNTCGDVLPEKRERHPLRDPRSAPANEKPARRHGRSEVTLAPRYHVERVAATGSFQVAEELAGDR